MIKNCLVCDAEYTVFKQQKYCSKSCNRKAYYQRHKGKLQRAAHDCFTQRTYGLTLDQIADLKVAQNYKCKICGVNEHEVASKRKTLFVDHCHATGKVRGLLCYLCNTLLGSAHDNKETLKAAIAYLEE